VESLTDIIRLHYDCVAAGDTQWGCFKATVRGVYEGQDVLRQMPGTLVLQQVWQSEPSVVMAIGEFDALDAAGGHRCVRFIDVWQFDAHRRIEQRQSFLSLGFQSAQA